MEICVRHVRMYTGEYTGKSQRLSTFYLFFLSFWTPLAHICVTIVAPTGTLELPQADNVSNTGYSYKQGVGKTKVVRSPSP